MNRGGKHEHTAFMNALAVKNDQLALEMLLHTGRDDYDQQTMHMMDMATDTGQHALSIAVRTQNLPMVRSMLARGAMCNVAENPILLAANTFRNFNIMKELLQDCAVGLPEFQQFKYSNDELHTLLYSNACTWNECGKDNKYNMWDLLLRWRPVHERNKLLETAFYLVFDRKLNITAPPQFLSSECNTSSDIEQMQNLYENTIQRWIHESGRPILDPLQRKGPFWR